MTYTCDHCDTECQSFWPSGGSDLICKTCFDGYTREQESDESSEDYATRHPYFVGAEDEYNPLEMARIFLRSVNEECPDLLDACKANVKSLQEKVKLEAKALESSLQGMEEEKEDPSCSCDACVVHKANPSANECGICEDALHDWVGIECLEMNDGSGDEMTVCCDCWQSNKSTLKEEGWENQDGSDSEESEPDVDDYDAPNIFPYKKCSACGERCSCGSYTTDKQWLCEGCCETT
jgi:hypothetical protein